MNTKQNESFLESLADNDNITYFAREYKEPGYTTEKDCILLGNWNQFTEDEMDIIEDHFEIEWLDEWTDCQECGGIVRTSPDCYGWTKSYHIFNDYEVICFDCIQENDYQEDVLEELMDNPQTALTLDIDPLEYGWTLNQDGFENGLHPHQTDNPVEIYNAIKTDSNHVLFVIDGVGQFDISFSVYVKEDNNE